MNQAAAFQLENEESPHINIPVFMERVLKMIEDLSDDIVCWSTAGDSFIVKKASPVVHETLSTKKSGSPFVRETRR